MLILKARGTHMPKLVSIKISDEALLKFLAFRPADRLGDKVKIVVEKWAGWAECAGCANSVDGKANPGLPGNLETGNFVCRDCCNAYGCHWTK